MILLKPVMWEMAHTGRRSTIHFIRVGSGDESPICHTMWAPPNVEVISPDEFHDKVREFGLCRGCSRTREGQMWMMDNAISRERPKSIRLTNRVIVSNLRQDADRIVTAMQSSGLTAQQKVTEAEKMAKDLRDGLQSLEWKMEEE